MVLIGSALLVRFEATVPASVGARSLKEITLVVSRAFLGTRASDDKGFGETLTIVRLACRRSCALRSQC